MICTAQRTSLVLSILFVAYELSGCSPSAGPISLARPTYTVGGTISGLAGSGLTFFRNGSSRWRSAVRPRWHSSQSGSARRTPILGSPGPGICRLLPGVRNVFPFTSLRHTSALETFGCRRDRHD
jgi:hypothetical protein